MASVNKWIGIGNLGQDPTVRYMPDGNAVATLSLACNETWKDKTTGEKKEATEWIRVVGYGRLAEIMGEYLKKGSLVYIEGSIHTRKWQDKEGIDRYTTEIKADRMTMLGGKQHDDDAGTQTSQQKRAAAPRNDASGKATKPAGAFDDMADDIPF